MSVPTVIISIQPNERIKMAHNLEVQDGEVAFALRGAPAWHNLANRIFAQDENVTTAKCLKKQS